MCLIFLLNQREERSFRTFSFICRVVILSLLSNIDIPENIYLVYCKNTFLMNNKLSRLAGAVRLPLFIYRCHVLYILSTSSLFLPPKSLFAPPEKNTRKQKPYKNKRYWWRQHFRLSVSKICGLFLRPVAPCVYPHEREEFSRQKSSMFQSPLPSHFSSFHQRRRDWVTHKRIPKFNW